MNNGWDLFTLPTQSVNGRDNTFIINEITKDIIGTEF